MSRRAVGVGVGVAVALVMAVVLAIAWAGPDDDDVSHLEEEVRAVVTIADLPITSVRALSECGRDSAGAPIPRFAQMSSPVVIDDVAAFVDDLAGRLEDEGYDDVEIASGHEVRAVTQDVTLQVLVGEGEARVRATDPISTC